MWRLVLPFTCTPLPSYRRTTLMRWNSSVHPRHSSAGLMLTFRRMRNLFHGLWSHYGPGYVEQRTHKPIFGQRVIWSRVAGSTDLMVIFMTLINTAFFQRGNTPKFHQVPISILTSSWRGGGTLIFSPVRIYRHFVCCNLRSSSVI